MSEDVDVSRALQLARLVVERDGTPWITKAGILVFHKDPRHLIGGAYVRYLRYDGSDLDSTLIRDETFEGPIPTIIQKLREFLPTQFSRFSFRRAGVLVSEDEYPTAAWDEALVNALVHRSYSQHARPVRLNHLRDRVEVISPGGYPLAVSPDRFVHNPRNVNLMESLRSLRFVRMAEEGTRTMRKVMVEAGLPEPVYSPVATTESVHCSLLNNAEQRLRPEIDEEQAARRSTAPIVTNIFPLRITSLSSDDFENLSGGQVSGPSYNDVRTAIIRRFRSAGFRVDSFTLSTAVDFSEEHVVPVLRGQKLLSIYPGVEFRLLQSNEAYFLVLDHTVEVRSRTNARDVVRLLPWLQLDTHRRCFVRLNQRWMAGYIAGRSDDVLRVEVAGRLEAEDKIIAAALEDVIPALNTSVELPALLKAAGLRVSLTQEIRRVALSGEADAPRRRLDRVEAIAHALSSRVFPVVIGKYEVRLIPEPASTNRRPLFLGRRLRDPKAQFDRQGYRQEQDVLRGLTTFGSLQKPESNLPLVLLGPARWAERMQDFVSRLRLGQRPYRGMEATFGLQLGPVSTVVAEPEHYERRALETIEQLPESEWPIFIVLSPTSRAGQASYDAPYYRMKHLLLEHGYPSQMVNEGTIESPNWKDLNFSLDLFAKAGYVPWVLGEGMPQVDLVIGLSSSIVTRSGQRSRMIGYANVFDEYGRWIFYQGSGAAVPFDQRNTMFAGLLQSITHDYQTKRRKLQWVHVHHSSRLRRADRDEIVRGIQIEAPSAEVSFVYLNEHSAYRLFDRSHTGDGAAARGSWVTLSPNSFIINTTGPNDMGQRYLGTPRPLEVRVNRIEGHGRLDLSTYAQQILSLTRLNWGISSIRHGRQGKVRAEA